MAHRIRRLQEVKPAIVVRELGWIQHAINIACSGWGQRLLQMISGHRDLRMLMCYTHLQTDDILAKLTPLRGCPHDVGRKKEGHGRADGLSWTSRFSR